MKAEEKSEVRNQRPELRNLEAELGTERRFS